MKIIRAYYGFSVVRGKSTLYAVILLLEHSLSLMTTDPFSVCEGLYILYDTLARTFPELMVTDQIASTCGGLYVHQSDLVLNQKCPYMCMNPLKIGPVRNKIISIHFSFQHKLSKWFEKVD